MKPLLAAAAALMLAGCVSSQEIPLSANAYRLEVSGTGRFGAGAVPQETLKRAARLTLSKGYTHFILDDPAMQTGKVYAGTVNGFPAMAQTRSTSVTVTMYRAGENSRALEAKAVLSEAS